MIPRINNGSLATGIGVWLAMAASAAGQGPAPGESAASKASKRLDELLQPGRTTAALFGSGPATWPGARSVEQPQLPPNAYQGTPPAPPLAKGNKPAPRALPEAAPPAAQGDPPPKIGMPTKPLPRLPSIDVETPLPLPILAHPKNDRASLDDATMEASQAAALVRVRPRRTEPVPFAPLNLPDPFENARVGGMRNPPAESEQPPAVPIRTPSR
jgi:hypothetical protein